MKKITLLFVLCFNLVSHSQINRWSVEANYPMIIDNNFVGQNFNGIIDLGVDYYFHEALKYRLSASFHNGLLKDRTEIIDLNTDFNYLLWFVQPRIKIDLIFGKMPNIHPYIGVGYCWMMAFTNGNTSTFFPQGSTNRSGFNAIVGLTFDINDKLYANGGYDFVRLSQLGNQNNAYLQNVNRLMIGVGYKF